MPPTSVSTVADTARLVEALRARLQSASGREVRVFETHISWVLLDGTHAWKLKKPVRLGFLDFADLSTRRHFCDEELRLNRRLAPQLYLDVVPIGGSIDAPRLGGDGDDDAIEFAVKMREFAPGALFSERLAAQALAPAHLEQLAQRLAAFHDAAPVSAANVAYGSAERIEADTAQVLDGLAPMVGEASIAELRERLGAQARALLATFERRRAAGRVREGHGDLHLANAVVLGDDVTAFDCIEFDPGLRWIDVASDIAFLAMDLLAHGRQDLAYRFLDAWLAASGDHDALAVLRYYMAYRALVRALVARIRAGQGGVAAGPDYLALARRLSQERDPRLLITHGLSGSGKSWVSQRLLERAGAIRLRSDVERKRLFGLRALADASAGPGEGIYANDVSRRTYEHLLALAGIALDAGFPTIVDATFLRAHERDAFRGIAQARGLPFAILHCRAEPALLRQRVAARQAGRADASDAGLAVLERQLAAHDTLRDDERALAIEIDTGVALDADALASRWRGVAGR